MPEPTIQLNEEHLPWTDGESLATLLARAGVQATEVATAVNKTFVSRDARATTFPQPGDVVTVFKPIVGG